MHGGATSDDEDSEQSIDAFAARDAEPPRKARPERGRVTEPAVAFARRVCELRHRPYWSWGFANLDRAAPVPMGSVVYLIGATGRGKSSFALQVARAHAEARGPALVFSAELAAEYACARLVSQVTRVSWFGVIRGDLDEVEVHRALDVPRLRLTDQVGPYWARDLESEICLEKEDRPGELVLAVVDYLQILRAEGRDPRERVAGASTALREIAARTGAVILALSKASRVAARGLRSGELVGSDATEVGAETNSIEHDAVAQVQLGAVRDAPDAEPGVRIVDLSIAKARFGNEDVVIPFEMNGAHGWFREHGDAVPVTVRRVEEKAERQARSQDRRVGQATSRILAVLQKAMGALSRNRILKAAGGRRADSVVAFATLLHAGDVVPVQGKRVGGTSPFALTSRLDELQLLPVSVGQE